MPSPRVVRGRELAKALTGVGVPATHDVRKVGPSPVVLVGPPRLAFEGYAGPVATWTLLCIAGTTEQHTGWQQIDLLLDDLAAVLPLEEANPTSFAPSPGADTRPAYAATYTETVES